MIQPPKLSIELIPQTCWFSNVRSHVSKKDWDKLRKLSYKQAHYCCEICGGKGPRWPVECHEIWNYNDEQKIQRLDGLIALCPSCHEVKHIGLAIRKGKERIAMAHLAKVNQWSLETAWHYVDTCFDVNEERSQHQWKLDIKWLESFGIKILKKEKATRQDKKELSIRKEFFKPSDLGNFFSNQAKKRKMVHYALISCVLLVMLGIKYPHWFSKTFFSYFAPPHKFTQLAGNHSAHSHKYYHTGDCTTYTRQIGVDNRIVDVHGKVCLDSNGNWILQS